jgi:uncharacterized membrane protein YhaH (DUF805 family)
MDTSALIAWASPDGRIGRTEYWLHFLLPTLVLAVSSTWLPFLGWAALWIFSVGCWKRVGDLPGSTRMKTGVVGLWVAATGIGAVIAVVLFFFGLLLVMGNGGPDHEPFWIGAGLLLVGPTGAVLLVAGFVPGGPPRDGAVSPTSLDGPDSYHGACASRGSGSTPGSAAPPQTPKHRHRYDSSPACRFSSPDPEAAHEPDATPRSSRPDGHVTPDTA